MYFDDFLSLLFLGIFVLGFPSAFVVFLVKYLKSKKKISLLAMFAKNQMADKGFKLKEGMMLDDVNRLFGFTGRYRGQFYIGDNELVDLFTWEIPEISVFYNLYFYENKVEKIEMKGL